MNELGSFRKSDFSILTAKDLISVLGLTIKKDETNKLITFLGLLSAYTEDSQLNISFNAPSSSGKSYLPTEIAKLFPKEDVLEVGYCSPTAFFHDVGEFNKEKGGYVVNFSGKILIFLDQPHTLLLQHLRPLLSHDKKEIQIKITDKSQKAGLRTKNVYLTGYPAVVFCTAGLSPDEQEATRFLLLSPEINQEKIREAISEKIRKEADPSTYASDLESDSERQALKQRILAIKEARIETIHLDTPELIEELFHKRLRTLKPRHQRDIGRVIGLVKVLSLLNLWHRHQLGSTILATREDVEEAFKIWDAISESQELNLPPYVHNLYKDVILPAYQAKNSELRSELNRVGLTRQDILQKHHEVYGRFLPDWQLRQQIVPPLETAGLVIQEPDPQDKRKILIYPTTPLTVSKGENNRELEGGVQDKDSEDVALDMFGGEIT